MLGGFENEIGHLGLVVRPQKSNAGLRNSRAVVPDQTTYLSDSGGRPKVEKNRNLRNEVAPECPPPPARK